MILLAATAPTPPLDSPFQVDWAFLITVIKVLGGIMGSVIVSFASIYVYFAKSRQKFDEKLLDKIDQTNKRFDDLAIQLQPSLQEIKLHGEQITELRKKDTSLERWLDSHATWLQNLERNKADKPNIAPANIRQS